MEIRIVGKASASNKTDCAVYFFENGAGYHAKEHKIKAPADRAEVFSAAGERLSLVINISAYRDYEIAEARRVAGGTALRYMRKWGSPGLLLTLDGTVSVERFRELVSGLLLADYEYLNYKSRPPVNQYARKVTIACGANAKAFQAELDRLVAIDHGVAFARDLANCPANDLGPGELIAAAQQLCKETGMAFKAMSCKQIEQDGYVGLQFVGRGSRRPPGLCSITYKPAKAAKDARPLCFLGKGVVFDTGGISIKPWDGMWDMKGDMGGAACVLGTMKAIAALKPDFPVIGIVVTAENMPDGDAYRPGDILRYRNGKTVEIHSTDAEGRLILADGLLYAQETLGLDQIVEFSTLTGACARALGRQFIGGFSRNAELLDQVLEAGQTSGEPVWHLPMSPEYRAMIKSSVADIKNVGGALAGASTAAMFLQEFIEDGTEYVHLDIAGVFLADKVEKYWSQPGATGAGVRLAVQLVEQLGA